MINQPNLISTLETDEQVLCHFKPGQCTTPMWWKFRCVAAGQPFPPDNIKVLGAVKARIYRSRWIADCPFCRAALPVSKVDPRFWCMVCRMHKNAGYAFKVLFPAAAATIETILSMRPERFNRNWSPNETVGQLAQENIDHGCTTLILPVDANTLTGWSN